MRLIDSIVLKPCPFCNAELIGEEEICRNPYTGITSKNTVYTHPQRNCILDYHRYHFYAHPEKIEQWNRRMKDGKVN